MNVSTQKQRRSIKDSLSFGDRAPINDFLHSAPPIAEAPLPGAKLIKIKVSEINPAPRNREWNFWEEQSQEAIIRRAVSFLNEGQLSPIIVREFKYDDPLKKYQCLAGHTRTESAELLVKEGYEEWKELWAFVYPEGACDDLQARRIIHYSNTEQRINISPKEKLNCFVFEWLDETNKYRSQNASGLITKMSEKYGLKKTRAYEYKAIAEKVIPEIKDLILEDKIALQEAKYISRIETIVQKHLYNKYSNELSKMKFRPLINLGIEEIDYLFENNNKITDIESYLKINSTTSEEVRYEARIPVRAEAQFRKAMFKLYKKYGFPQE